MYILGVLDARFVIMVDLWESVRSSVVVVRKYTADSAALAFDPHAKLRHAARAAVAEPLLAYPFPMSFETPSRFFLSMRRHLHCYSKIAAGV
jgi:hypothetical protein